MVRDTPPFFPPFFPLSRLGGRRLRLRVKLTGRESFFFFPLPPSSLSMARPTDQNGLLFRGRGSFFFFFLPPFYLLPAVPGRWYILQ